MKYLLLLLLIGPLCAEEKGPLTGIRSLLVAKGAIFRDFADQNSTARNLSALLSGAGIDSSEIGPDQGGMKRDAVVSFSLDAEVASQKIPLEALRDLYILDVSIEVHMKALTARGGEGVVCVYRNSRLGMAGPDGIRDATLAPIYWALLQDFVASWKEQNGVRP